jgi:indolepyruvate ferredoxin oxidoreductase
VLAAAGVRRWSETLDEIVDKRAAFLASYQDEAYARRYARPRLGHPTGGGTGVPGSTAVSEAAARNLFKLMAIKDEYEVARLYTDGSG